MKFLRNLKTRIGHRGAFLLFLALLDILIGYSFLIVPKSPIPFLIPLHVWAWIWLVAGGIVFTGVFQRRDRIQFGVAAGVKTLFAASYLRLWILFGVPHAWVSVVVWTAFAAIIVVISSWPEVRRSKKRDRTGEG